MRSIAERVASRVGEGGASRGAPDAGGTDELSQLRAALSEMQQRLAHVESHVAHAGDCAGQGSSTATNDLTARSSPQASARQAPTPQPARFLSNTYVPATHPSLERFGVGEAVSELVDFFESEKTCTVEPGGKPCDHCSMCSSRGF